MGTEDDPDYINVRHIVSALTIDEHRGQELEGMGQESWVKGQVTASQVGFKTYEDNDNEKLSPLTKNNDFSTITVAAIRND